MAEGPTRNGNELALEFSTAKEARREEIRKEANGKLFFFRYLRVVTVEKGETNGLKYVRMSTVEPGSDMRVEFVVDKEVSLRIAEPLKEHDAVAVTGRLRTMGENGNRIVLEPAVVRHKDRPAPRAGKELLYEVNPEARKGTDTSSGREEIRYEGKKTAK